LVAISLSVCNTTVHSFSQIKKSVKLRNVERNTEVQSWISGGWMLQAYDSIYPPTTDENKKYIGHTHTHTQMYTSLEQK